jgi:hypothetical protein
VRYGSGSCGDFMQGTFTHVGDELVMSPIGVLAADVGATEQPAEDCSDVGDGHGPSCGCNGAPEDRVWDHVRRHEELGAVDIEPVLAADVGVVVAKLGEEAV